MPLIYLLACGLARMIRDDLPFDKSGTSRLFETTAVRLNNHTRSAPNDDAAALLVAVHN